MEEKLEMAGARSRSTLQRSIPVWMSQLLGFCLLILVVAVSEPSASGQGNFLQITNLKVASEGWRLGWETGTNAAFTVQYQETLRDGIWRIPDSALPVATNYWIEPVGTNASRFYRVTGVPQADRGKVLGAPTFVRTVSLLELGFYYSQGLLPVAPRYSVRLYKVVYETITPIGGKTRASGALILPESTGRPLPLISYQHGTITQTNKAPSAMETTGEAFVGVAMATAGYAVVEAGMLVDEVVVDTVGQSLVRFYFVRPLTEGVNNNAVNNLTERAKELLDYGGQRAGTDVHKMVVKKYPEGNYARTVEYRLLSAEELGALYGSVRNAWESGRGRTFTIK